MSLEIRKIKEIQSGVFWTLLDRPTSKLLRFILSDEYRFVWCHKHSVGNYLWEDYRLPLFEDRVGHELLMKLAVFDFIVTTEKFKEILPKFDAGIHVIQLNRLPPQYLDLDKVKGKERYRLLGECDWLFEFDVPGNDYGQVLSPKREFLLDVLRKTESDREDLS